MIKNYDKAIVVERGADKLLSRCEMQKVILSFLALASVNFPRAEAADQAEPSAPPGETKRVRWASAPPVRQNTCRAVRMKDNRNLEIPAQITNCDRTTTQPPGIFDAYDRPGTPAL